MNNNVTCVLSFAAGATIASVVTWKVLKNKYKRIADEEIASVKEVFSKRSEVVQKEPEEKPDLTEYNNKLQEEGYTNYSDIKTEEKGEPMAMDKPYVISPDEFDENGYPTISLTYYADGILTDFSDNVIDNVDELVGEESLTHFGDYEDDSVFVRNDKLKLDIEILLDERNFSDINKSPQHTVIE